MGDERLFPADVRLAPPLALSPFECALLEKIWLTPYTPALQRGPVAMHYCRLNTLFALQQLPQVARAVKSNAPKFVFAHIVAPHFPFIFDRQGKDISRRVTERLAAHCTKEEFQQIFRESYAAQATFISAQIGKVVEAILAHAPRPPVIIIQGDHGARGIMDYGRSPVGGFIPHFKRLLFARRQAKPLMEKYYASKFVSPRAQSLLWD